MPSPEQHDDALAQIVGLGKSPQAWIWNATVLRRSSEALLALSANGVARHVELAFRDASPAPGEVRRRSADAQEVSALLDSHCGAVGLMLLAASVECLLKAKLTRDGVEMIDSNGVLNQKYATHDLRRLAIQAGLALTDPQLNTLDGLRAFMEWRGRYPIPKRWERIRDLANLDLGSIAEFQANALALVEELGRQFVRERTAP